MQNGVVTLGGHARTDVDRDSALALVSTYPGVKDVIDEIEVDPVSIMDDQTRMAVARAVYGYPSLNKYAIDPAKPIRISVQNGHVELYGMVDTQADKEIGLHPRQRRPRRLQREELLAGRQPAQRSAEINLADGRSRRALDRPSAKGPLLAVDGESYLALDGIRRFNDGVFTNRCKWRTAVYSRPGATSRRPARSGWLAE